MPAKVVDSKKKPKAKTKTKHYQTQSVKQSVVVHVTIPKSRRKKTGSIPRKAVRVPMTRMLGTPTHLNRPTSNPYDSLFRSINSPFKATTAASLPTGDTYASIQTERLKHFNNASTDTGGFEDVKPDPNLGSISIENLKKYPLDVAVAENPKKAMGDGNVNLRQSSSSTPSKIPQLRNKENDKATRAATKALRAKNRLERESRDRGDDETDSNVRDGSRYLTEL